MQPCRQSAAPSLRESALPIANFDKVSVEQDDGLELGEEAALGACRGELEVEIATTLFQKREQGISMLDSARTNASLISCKPKLPAPDQGLSEPDSPSDKALKSVATDDIDDAVAAGLIEEIDGHILKERLEHKGQPLSIDGPGVARQKAVEHTTCDALELRECEGGSTHEDQKAVAAELQSGSDSAGNVANQDGLNMCDMLEAINPYRAEDRADAQLSSPDEDKESECVHCRAEHADLAASESTEGASAHADQNADAAEIQSSKDAAGDGAKQEHVAICVSLEAVEAEGAEIRVHGREQEKVDSAKNNANHAELAASDATEVVSAHEDQKAFAVETESGKDSAGRRAKCEDSDTCAMVEAVKTEGAQAHIHEQLDSPGDVALEAGESNVANAHFCEQLALPGEEADRELADCITKHIASTASDKAEGLSTHEDQSVAADEKQSGKASAGSSAKQEDHAICMALGTVEHCVAEARVHEQLTSPGEVALESAKPDRTECCVHEQFSLPGEVTSGTVKPDEAKVDVQEQIASSGEVAAEAPNPDRVEAKRLASPGEVTLEAVKPDGAEACVSEQFIPSGGSALEALNPDTAETCIHEQLASLGEVTLEAVKPHAAEAYVHEQLASSGKNTVEDLFADKTETHIREQLASPGELTLEAVKHLGVHDQLAESGEVVLEALNADGASSRIHEQLVASPGDVTPEAVKSHGAELGVYEQLASCGEIALGTYNSNRGETRIHEQIFSSGEVALEVVMPDTANTEALICEHSAPPGTGEENDTEFSQSSAEHAELATSNGTEAEEHDASNYLQQR